MSLTRFLNNPDVVARVKPFRPNLPHKIAGSLKVEPLTTNYTLVGTAFDYLLRFELQRRAPYAIAKRLVAESAPDLIWQPHIWIHLPMNTSQDEWMDTEEVAKKAAENARAVEERSTPSHCCL